MISFCIPSRGRPRFAKRLVESAIGHADHKTEFLFYLNDDDPTLEEYKDVLDNQHYTVGPNQSTCYSWNMMAKKASHDLIMLMGDDVEIQTMHWDTLISEQFQKYNDKILLVVPSDGRQKGSGQFAEHIKKPKLWDDTNLPAPHFAVHRNWINTTGYLAPPFFWHFFVDTYTQKLARRINRCLYMPNVVFKAKKLFDDTAGQVRTHLNIKDRDDETWRLVGRYLNADIQNLKNFISNYPQ